MKEIELKVEGMSCSMCSGAVTKLLTELPGISEVNVNLENAEASVTFDENATDTETILQAFATSHYQASLN